VASPSLVVSRLRLLLLTRHPAEWILLLTGKLLFTLSLTYRTITGIWAAKIMGAGRIGKNGEPDAGAYVYVYIRVYRVYRV